MKKPRQQIGFYVGYLPMPGGHARLLKVLLPAVIVVIAAMATLIARGQRDPGDGVWHNVGDAQTWTGVLVERPFAALVVPSEQGETTFLLVEMTKQGGRKRAAGLEGYIVTARGWLLERDGQHVIELVPEADALVKQSDVANSAASLELVRESVTMTGEILDSKCYLGAMKPGDGMGHRACAQLCIAGGIPPMLISTDEDGVSTYTMLMSSTESDLPGIVMEYVGIPVSTTGTLYRFADVQYLDIDAGSVKRVER